MPYEPLILSYDELRHHAEEFLAENYPETSIPIPIEEIGHYWLHDDLYQAVAIGSVADWKRVQAQIGDEYQWFEFQANAFAGLVLVPPVALKARFIRRVEEAKAVGLDHASLLRHPLRHRMVEGLAGEFVVSEQTMAIRLEKDGLLPPLTQSR